MKTLISVAAGLLLASTSLAKPESAPSPAAVQPMQSGSPATDYFPGWFPPHPPYMTPGIDWWIHPDYMSPQPAGRVVDDQMKPV